MYMKYCLSSVVSINISSSVSYQYLLMDTWLHWLISWQVWMVPQSTWACRVPLVCWVRCLWVYKQKCCSWLYYNHKPTPTCAYKFTFSPSVPKVSFFPHILTLCFPNASPSDQGSMALQSQGNSGLHVLSPMKVIHPSISFDICWVLYFPLKCLNFSICI